MARTSEALRRELADSVAGQEGGGRRYPAVLKRRATAYATERRAAGSTTAVVAAELGLAHVTLSRWMAASETTFRPVELAPAKLPASPRLVVVSPSGFRIEGLALTDVVDLLRAMA